MQRYRIKEFRHPANREVSERAKVRRMRLESRIAEAGLIRAVYTLFKYLSTHLCLDENGAWYLDYLPLFIRN